MYGVMDLGELAARLGAVSTHDRRGYALWQDHFADGLAPWDSGTLGTGAAVTVVTSYAYRGAQAVKLSGGSAASGRAWLAKYLPAAATSRYGLEAAVNVWSSVTSIDLYLQVGDSIDTYEVRLRWLPVTSEFQVYNDAGQYVTVASGVTLLTGPGAWHVLKVVADLDTLRYVRVILDNLEVDVSDHAIYAPGNPGSLYVYSSITLTGDSDGGGVAYVGAAIVTREEP